MENPLPLCDFCGQPEEIHMGFDHRQGKCLLARGLIDLCLRYPEQRAREVIRRVNAWAETQDSKE